MLNFLLNSNISMPLLIVLTVILVINDRVFPRYTRRAFYTALISCYLLTIFPRLDFWSRDLYAFTLNNSIRPIILLSMIWVMDHKHKDRTKICISIPAVLNALLTLLNLKFQILCGVDPYGELVMKQPLCYFGSTVFVIYGVYIIHISVKNSTKEDTSEYAFFFACILMVVFAALSEILLGNKYILGDTLGLVVCVYYFCKVMQTYKRDALTKLPLRHNLNFEMEDLQESAYHVSLLDVDNFKMINDKYGHDRGDEVLVTVVRCVNDNLLKKSRLFRFGGDEFVVISKKSNEEQIQKMFDTINEKLKERDLRISHGTVKHEPGENPQKCLISADEAMYENKRMIKSENIWDDMTGLYNFRGFTDELDSVRRINRGRGKKFCLVCMDVEHLGNINMGFGYTEGNMIISTLARILKGVIKGGDFAGHLGSDEFCVALEMRGDEFTAQKFTDKLIKCIDSAYEFTGKEYTVEMNFGIYVIDNDNDATEDCINRVLYQKQQEKDNRRKNDVIEGTEDYNQEEEEQVLELLKENKLRYAFQPIVSAKDGQIVAYEALMRSGGEKMISPLKIIKYATKNNKIYDLEKKTFTNVFERITGARDYNPERRIFINSVPGYLLSDFDYEYLQKKYKDLYSNVVVEITEQRELREEDLKLLLERRKKDGFNLAIDDFGSGCSNTNSLLRYMPQVIKLDRLLITDIDKNSKKQFFVNSIIAFARENNMQVLAEGVETAEELKMVLHLGVDLIQGFFTAKPAFEMLDAISEETRKLIVDENLKIGANTNKKVYIASNNKDLSLVALALEDYTQITISSDEVALIGNPDYTAEMYIKIKEGTNCVLTLEDVRLDSIDELPCIDIEEGANLSIRLVGESQLNTKGIHVPEGSSLTMLGSGNLKISAKGQSCYGIGSGPDETVGSIIFENSGILEIKVDGERCIAIGGGTYREGAGIDVRSGGYNIQVAGVNAVGFGSVYGNIPISIVDCALNMIFRVDKGVAIGSVYGRQDICIRNFNMDVNGSASKLSVIGSADATGGKFEVGYGTFRAKLNGQKVIILGVGEGEADIEASHVRFDILGEGDEVIGFGSGEKKGSILIVDCNMDMIINSAVPIAIGAMQEKTNMENSIINIRINGE